MKPDHTEAVLSQLLQNYHPTNRHEIEMARRLGDFLSSATEHDFFGRDMAGTQPHWGHVTGSAWIVNTRGDKTVLVYHAKLGKWVQPGGHCDGQSDVLGVALREAREETGLDVQPFASDGAIFDVDVHEIPQYWNTPPHFHYDVRFLLVADENELPIVSEESHAVRWVALDEVSTLSDEESLRRMVEKTQRKFSTTAGGASD